MDPTTIVIPPVVVAAAIWVIRAIALWLESEFNKRS
jgi:hypothetical protein